MNDDPRYTVLGTGVQQHVDGAMLSALDRRMEEAYDYAIKSETHLWIMAVTFKVSEKHLKERGTEDIPLDVENMMDHALGCYVCEKVFNPRLLGHRCTGELKHKSRR